MPACNVELWQIMRMNGNVRADSVQHTTDKKESTASTTTEIIYKYKNAEGYEAKNYENHEGLTQSLHSLCVF